MQRKKQKGRAYGGILVYYEKELKYILAFLEKSSENFYGLKSHKSQGYIHADRVFYLVAVYNSPNIQITQKETTVT